MDVVSVCPLRVASVPWQTHDGRWIFTFVAKATFALRPMESPLAPEQDEPNEMDGHWDDDETKSLNAASDLAPFKLRADVVVTGYAHAPRGQPATSLVARVAVGALDKSIEVLGDRAIRRDGTLRGPAPFSRIPLRWERAAGGPGTVNPVGVRLDAPPDHYGARILPNFQPPGLPPNAQPIPPVGLGPLAPGWPRRAEQLFHHAADFPHRAWHQRPLPGDIDYGYFNAAPTDQQLDELRGDERIVLEHLHPEYPKLTTTLRAGTPWASVEQGGERRMISLRCDTLCIDTNRFVCTLVWRGHVALQHPGEAGRVTIGLLASETSTASRSAAALLNEDETVDTRGLPVDETLPGSERTQAIRLPGPPGTPRTTLDHARSILPFSPATYPPAPSPAAANPPIFDESSTIPPGAPVLDALPFRPAIADEPTDESSVPTGKMPALADSDPPPAPRTGMKGMMGSPLGRVPTEPPPAPEPPRPALVAPEPPEPEPFTPEPPRPVLVAPEPPPPMPPPIMTPSEAPASPAPRVVEPPSEPRGASPVERPRPRVIEAGGAAASASGSPVRASVVDRLAHGASLQGIDLAGADLEGLDFHGRSLAGLDLSRARLARCVLRGADLTGAQLQGANLTDADLRAATLAGADLTDAVLARANLRDALVDDATFTGAHGADAILCGVRGKRASFARAEWIDADFSGAQIEAADFTGAALDNATFTGATLARVTLDEARGRGVVLTGAHLLKAQATGLSLERSDLDGASAPGSVWERAELAECSFDHADLRGASFVGATCKASSFAGADLRDARLGGADLARSSFSRANLENARMASARAEAADFSGARLEAADLQKAHLARASLVEASVRYARADGSDLSGARLVRADLRNVSLRHAKLHGADLSYAQLADADLRNADLEKANLFAVVKTRARTAGANLQSAVTTKPKAAP